MSDARVPSAIDGLAWTYEGREVHRDDPEALAGYPTPEFVDRAALLLAESYVLDGMPTADQLKWALGIFAVSEGVTRRGEDPASSQVRDRLLRYQDSWDERDVAWPEALTETPEQRETRKRAVEQWRQEGESNR